MLSCVSKPLSDQHSLPRWPEGEPQTIDEWRFFFHMSVIYASDLADDRWNDLVSELSNVKLPPLEWVSHQAELVLYEDHKELGLLHASLTAGPEPDKT